MAEFNTPYTTPPEPPAARRKWPLAGVMAIDFVIALVMFVTLTLLVQLIFIGLRMAQQGLSLNDLQAQLADRAAALRLIGADGLFVTLLMTNLAFALIPIVRVRLLRREPLATIGFQAARPFVLAGVGVAIGVLSLVVNAALSVTFRQYGIVPDQTAQFPLFAGEYLGQALFLVGAAILAPIGEEILFRGYVFNALHQTFAQRPWGVPLAYILSALLFAVMHAGGASQGLPALLTALFAIGLLLAWVMHATRSLLPCIIAHAINNGAALVGLLICVNTPGLAGCPAL